MAAASLVTAIAVFLLMCALFLKRDLTAPGLTLREARATITSETMDELSLATLEAQRRQAARELRAMLQAQRVVLGFLEASSPQSMLAFLDAPTAPAAALQPLMDARKQAAAPLPFALKKKRRLPDDEGYTATWQVGPWLLETDDRSGVPKIRWEPLQQQLAAHPSASALANTGSTGGDL